MADEPRRKSTARRLAGWPLVAALAVAAFALGYAGFQARLADRSVLDLAYLSLQLFALESGNAAGPAPPAVLEIARFLAPVATAYALGRAVIKLFQAQIDQWRLRGRSGHVVVVGLGWLGLPLVEQLVDRRRKVAALALELDDELVAAAHRMRVPVVVGDARDPKVLRESRAHRADHVVVLAGTDEISAEIALSLKSLFADARRGETVCLAHIRDPQLCRMLRTEALMGPPAPGFRMEFFNVAEEAAAIMLDEHAEFLAEARPVRIGVVGGNDVAAAVISEAARTRRLHGLEPIHVVIAGSGGMMRRLHARFPQLRTAATVDEIDDPPGMLSHEAHMRLADCDVVFVCIDQDTDAIAVSLALADHLGGIPVVVALGEWAGMAGMLSTGSKAGAVYPFLIPSRLLDADLLLAGLGERLAREVHANYIKMVTTRPTDPTEAAEWKEPDPDDPALQDWKDLREEYRQSSRAQAAHLGAKLQRIDCGVAPLADWDEPVVTLTSDEVERLARFEHERFVEERLAAKWKWGPTKDVGRKESPYLVPWEELTEPIRDLDRAAARVVPLLLARAGYRLIRKDGTRDVRP